ncbi:hypothetical protein ACET3Z_029688 [Daucus carota]
MGSIEDDDNDDKTQVGDDFSDKDTQFMDTQSFLDGSGSFDNTVPFEDAETQVVCLAGETQVLDFDCETQAVDNLDCTENLCTQLYDDFDMEVVGDTDDEGTKKTELVSDTEELSDVDSLKELGSHPGEPENILQTDVHKQSGGACKDIPVTKECNTGPVLRGFTSLRVASVRSAGLAARDMGLRRTKGASYSSVSDNLHEAGHSGRSVVRDLYDFDKRFNLEEHDLQMKGLTSENRCRAGKSAMRKLFNDDISREKGVNEYLNTDKGEMLPPVCTMENDLAGLSYVDSQEPGEASQTIALDFVDKFLKVNVTDFDEESDVIKSTGGKSKVLSGARGTQCFAKNANRNYLASSGIYDWDDDQEDEGGGEFYRKKKHSFFDDGCRGHKSFTQPRDSKHHNVKRRQAVKVDSGKVVQQDSSSNVPELFYSDSKLLLHKNKENAKLMKVAKQSIGKNLIKDLDEVQTGAARDNLDMLGIGADTQLAAEAMETLCCGVGMTDCNSDVDNQDAEIHFSSSAERKLPKNSESDKGFLHKKASRALKSRVSTIQSNQSKRSSRRLTKGSSIVSELESMKTRKQWDEAGDLCNLHCGIVEENLNKTELEECGINETERCHTAASACQKRVKKRSIEEHFSTFSPIAFRTRQKMSNQNQRDTNTSTDLREKMDSLAGSNASKKKRRTASNADARGKSSELKFIQPSNSKETKETHTEQNDTERCGISTAQKEKPCQKLPKEKINGKSGAKSKILQVNSGIKRTTRSSVRNPASPVMDRQCGNILAKDTSVVNNPIEQIGNATSKGSTVLLTPIQCKTPVNEASPICMGDEYHKQSCRKNLLRSPLKKNSSRISADGPESAYACEYLQKKRNITQLQVLFSKHMDEDIIKQQKKVLTRLGVSEASSISDATHFVTDKFVRTRNMLEAIAKGKPVVTHFWLVSCGQAGCLVDEQNYILRDAKKEKEIGFSLPVSLARACQHPLLQGCKVFITRNTKPGKDILAGLVKAVHGVVVERIGRSALRDERIPSDLIILSCEEDYADCVPFLEKGASVYSSELLLNGIVIQKLEYQRYRLFAENIRKTRSTVWLRKDGELIPVAKCK